MRDIKVPAVLFVAGVLTRMPFTSRMLYNWDSVEFALATEHYDVALHNPHPPGYFLYVMAGKFLNVFTVDPNASFVSISVIMSGLAVSAIYQLSLEAFGRRTAFFSAVFALTSPLLWFHGEAASTYIVEAFFTSFLALLLYRVSQGESRLLWAATLLLALLGGIRQSAMVFMLPLWAYSMRKSSPGRILAATALLAAGVLAWFLPMLEMTGGFAKYRAASDELYRFAIEPYSLTPANFSSSVLAVLKFTVYGIGIGAAILLAATIRQPSSVFGKETPFFLFWFAPPVLFCLFVFVHPEAPGQGMIFMPAVIIAASRALDEVSKRLTETASAALVLLVTAFNLYTFFSPETPVSHKSLKRSADYVSDFALAVRRSLPPSETVILSMNFLNDGPMHYIYYMPEYGTYIMDGGVDGNGARRKVFWGKGQEKFVSEGVLIPRGVKYFVSPHPGELNSRLRGLGNDVKTLFAGGRDVAVYGDIKHAPQIYREIKFIAP